MLSVFQMKSQYEGAIRRVYPLMVNSQEETHPFALVIVG